MINRPMKPDETGSYPELPCASKTRPLPSAFVVLMVFTILANIASAVFFFLSLASVDRALVMPTIRFMVIVVGSVLFLIGLARWLRWRAG